MNITKIRRKRTAVVVEYENEGNDYVLTAHEPPLPSFDAALKAITPLVVDILHLPKAYLGTKSEEEEGKVLNELTVSGITITTKQEVRLVTIVAKKDLPDAHSPFNIATPLRFLEHPDEEGSYSPALSDKQGALIEELIEEAKKYVKGERAQGTLPLDQEEDEDGEGEAEPAEGRQIPFRS
jgi:hypothetical protein